MSRVKCQECDRDFDPEETDHPVLEGYPVCFACNEDFRVREEAEGFWSELYEEHSPGRTSRE